LDVSASSLVSTASRSFSKRARNDRTFSRGSAASLASARRASRSARRDASMPRSRSCRAWRGGKARTSAEGERERDAEEGAVLYESLTRGRPEGTARGARSRGTDTRTNHHLRALRLHIRVGGVLHDNLLVTHGAGRCAALRDRKGTASSLGRAANSSGSGEKRESPRKK
jgi:hypothetical protein